MTLLQIQYAIACAETGSISKAAQSLFTSTSNLSRTIKALEQELGFDVFNRTTNGITLTEEGARFLSHAAAIQEECSRISQIRDKKSHSFSCCCMHLPYCYMAFESLCRYYEKDEHIALSLNTGFLSECIDAVSMRQCQLGVISMPETIEATERDYISKAGLSMELLCRQHLNLNLRKGHPALDGYTPGQPFDFSQLKNYPYVSYSSYGENVIHPLDLSHHSYFPLGAVNTAKSISINNADWKCRLIGSTDAFGFGTSVSPALTDAYNWQCIPLEGYVSGLYYVYPTGSALSEEAERYIAFLREILKNNPC